jgi:hypothetical protein
VNDKREVDGERQLFAQDPAAVRGYATSVNARTKKVLEEALELPRDERVALAQELLVSVDGEDPDAAEAWAEIIRRRTDDVLAGRAHGPECRPFLAELRERLRRGT